MSVDKSYINQYTETFGLSRNIRLKNMILELVDMINEYFTTDIQDIFLPSIENSNDTYEIKEIWMFAENIWLQLKIINSSYRIETIIPKNLSRFNLEKSPLNPSLSSWDEHTHIKINFFPSGQESYMLEARSVNCEYLNKIIQNHFMSIL